MEAGTHNTELVAMAHLVIQSVKSDNYEQALDWAIQLAGLVSIARDNANR